MFNEMLAMSNNGGGGTLDYTQYTQSENQQKTYEINNGVVVVRGASSYSQRVLLELYFSNGSYTEITKNATATYSYLNGILTCSFAASWSTYLIDVFKQD